MMVRCDDIEIVGAILQDLCQEFEVHELQPLIYFPYAMKELQHNLKKVNSLSHPSLPYALISWTITIILVLNFQLLLPKYYLK